MCTWASWLSGESPKQVPDRGETVHEQMERAGVNEGGIQTAALLQSRSD
jgi:hypothetical protein